MDVTEEGEALPRCSTPCSRACRCWLGTPKHPWVLFPSQKPPQGRSRGPCRPAFHSEVPHARPPEVTRSQVSCHCLGSSVLALQEPHPSDSHPALLWDTRTARWHEMEDMQQRGHHYIRRTLDTTTHSTVTDSWLRSTQTKWQKVYSDLPGF